jgi:rod shape-determining protein MreD
MMLLYFFAFFGLASAFTILQTSVLHFFPFLAFFPLPDLAFAVLVFIAFLQGEMQGQMLGFTTGLVYDCLSLAPFGFNAFIRTVMGYVIGRFKGVILLDSMLLPMAIVALAMVVKTLLSMLAALVLGQSGVVARVLSLDFVFEFLLTVVFAPVVYLIVRSLGGVILSRKAYRQ